MLLVQQAKRGHGGSMGYGLGDCKVPRLREGPGVGSQPPCLGYNKLYTLKGTSMDTITYSAARASLASTMDKVCQDHEPMIITRGGQQAVVMLSLEDFKSLEETSYLLRSPENAKRLLSSVTALAKGKGKERQLAE